MKGCEVRFKKQNNQSIKLHDIKKLDNTWNDLFNLRRPNVLENARTPIARVEAEKYIEEVEKLMDDCMTNKCAKHLRKKISDMTYIVDIFLRSENNSSRQGEQFHTVLEFCIKMTIIPL